MQCRQCGRILSQANLEAKLCPSCGAAAAALAPTPVAPVAAPPNRVAQVAAGASHLEDPGVPSFTPAIIDIERLDAPVVPPTPAPPPSPAPTPVILMAEESVSTYSETLIVTQSASTTQDGKTTESSATFAAMAAGMTTADALASLPPTAPASTTLSPTEPVEMQCAQCGRDITASRLASGTCPSCGNRLPMAAPVAFSTPESPVAPAPPIAPVPAVVPTLSELPVPPIAATVTPIPDAPPAATPPPTVTPVPAPIPDAPPAAVVAPVAAVPLAPTPVVAPVASPRPPIAKVFDTPPPAPRRLNPFVIVVLVLVVLALIAAGIFAYLSNQRGSPAAVATSTSTPLATATATQVPTPTLALIAGVPAPAAGYQQFGSPDGAYSLNYPVSWAATAQSLGGGTTGLPATTTEVFIPLDFSTVFAVVPVNMQVPPAQYTTLIEQVLQGFPGAQGVVVNPTTTTVKIGANSWTKITGTFTFNAQPQAATALIAPHGTSTYALAYFAAQAKAADAETTTFQPIAQSFTFLK